MRPEVLQSVALAVAQARSVESVLGGIVQGLGGEGDIALARIWLIEPGYLFVVSHARRMPRSLSLSALGGECRLPHADTRRLVSSRRRLPPCPSECPQSRSRQRRRQAHPHRVEPRRKSVGGGSRLG